VKGMGIIEIEYGCQKLNKGTRNRRITRKETEEGINTGTSQNLPPSSTNFF